MTKKCSKCKKIQLLTEFHKQKKAKDGLCGHCRTCKSSYYKIYYSKNKASLYQNYKKWTINNREKYLAGKTRYATKHRILIREKANKVSYKNRILLTDQHVRYIITRRTDLKTSDIPNELVKVKRTHLQLLRAIKDEQNKE